VKEKIKFSQRKCSLFPLQFKAASKVEVDSKEVYDATEKLKFLLDSVEGSATSCLAKFMLGSDRYRKEAHRSISSHSERK